MTIPDAKGVKIGAPAELRWLCLSRLTVCFSPPPRPLSTATARQLARLVSARLSCHSGPPRQPSGLLEPTTSPAGRSRNLDRRRAHRQAADLRASFLGSGRPCSKYSTRLACSSAFSPPPSRFAASLGATSWRRHSACLPIVWSTANHLLPSPAYPWMVRAVDPASKSRHNLLIL